MSALVEGERSASFTGRLTLWERSIRTNWIRGWLGQKVGLKSLEFAHAGLRTPTFQPVALRYTD
jgi:hypothetical protein